MNMCVCACVCVCVRPCRLPLAPPQCICRKYPSKNVTNHNIKTQNHLGTHIHTHRHTHTFWYSNTESVYLFSIDLSALCLGPLSLPFTSEHWVQMSGCLSVMAANTPSTGSDISTSPGCAACTSGEVDTRYVSQNAHPERLIRGV